MPARLVPNSVKIITQDGEVQMFITLELNINLNTNGVISTIETETKKTLEKPVKENTEWAIPDFGSTKIDFGKKS